MEFWRFPEIECKPKVKVLNRKYCRLYPRREFVKLKKLEPNFDHCKTLYTKCDFKVEACVHEQILLLEDKFKEHAALMDTEMESQNKLIEKLWELSQRYLILKSGGVCVKLYPEIVSAPAEYDAQCDFQLKLKKLNKSNAHIALSLQFIREALKELDHRCTLLDMTVESPLIAGNAFQQPLAYMREIIADLFHYYYGVLCKLKCWAQLLDIGDAGAIEDYMILVKPSSDYENFVKIGIEGCTCRKTKNPECIFCHESCI